jgi:hypothetical protein
MRPMSKIIQVIQVVGSEDLDIICLCEDGSLWRFWPNHGSKWTMLHEMANVRQKPTPNPVPR